MISNTYSDNIYKLEIQQESEIKEILQILSEAKLLTKSSIKQLLETVMHKLPLLFKHSKQLYNKVNSLIKQAQDLTINRAFYELLTIFATYLTDF